MDFAFIIDGMPPEKISHMLERGFRHFGNEFFIYTDFDYGGVTFTVIPLRIRLQWYTPTKKQRKNLRVNSDLACSISPTVLTQEYVELFEQHKTKFPESAPNSIFDLFSETPAVSPCKNVTLSVRHNNTLIAASFFDVLPDAVSSVYAAYDLKHAKRGLGIFTMLKEIEYAQLIGKCFYYQGYASVEPSFYDYKKKFNGLEYLDFSDMEWKLA